jgi:outer membrane protein OmpA-like peptidoglycan-associated protein
MRSQRSLACDWLHASLVVRALAAAAAIASDAPAQRTLPLPPPPSRGVSIVQTLSTAEGDRESVHFVVDADPRRLRWTWALVEVSANGGDTVRQEYRYAELREDIDAAIRFRAFHEIEEDEEHPGYTMHAISRAVYRRLRAAGSDTFQVMAVDSPTGGLASFALARRATPVRWRGTLSLVTPSPVPFPLLVNGRRVEVPALHVRGRFTLRTKTWEPQLWVLADSTYPLLLKWIGAHTQATNVLQTIRVDGLETLPDVERELASSCRAELPGIYFAFNSAVLDAASERTIGDVADLLVRHPEWTVTLEGHTDSIGSDAPNRALSERRVAAVRSRLLLRHHKVDEARVRAIGLGSARPREPNATIEGRARNRRVELVRDCGGR